MSSRAYLAWDMLATAEYEDGYLDNKKLHPKTDRLSNPLLNISENKFFDLYRLTKDAFQRLCELLHKYADLKSTQRVSLHSKVMSALSFYANGDCQRVVGKVNHFSQEALSMYIEEVTTALNHPNILHKIIKFPVTRLERATIEQSFYNKYEIPGVIGCIDGSHFKIIRPNKDEEHLCFGTKDYYSLNAQIICDSDCRILSVNAKFGGATHDAVAWEDSNIKHFLQYLHTNKELVWLIGDSDYPLQPWLMTPYSDPAPNSSQTIYNTKHTSARAVILNTLDRLKNRWRCLRKTLRYKPEKCAKIILACCVLHNFALQYEVPDPEFNKFQESQESSHRKVLLVENEDSSDLLMGRVLRDQLATKLMTVCTNGE